MSKETITINVTATDIETGEASNCFRCPIAKAMIRQIPGCDSAEARQAVLYFRRGRQEMRAKPPQEVREFMETFDNGRIVHPFSFTAIFKTGTVDRDGKEQLHQI